MSEGQQSQGTCFANASILADHLVSSMEKSGLDRLHIRFHAGNGFIKRADVMPFDLPYGFNSCGQVSAGTLQQIREALRRVANPAFHGMVSIYVAKSEQTLTVQSIQYFTIYRLDLPEKQFTQQLN